MRFSKILNQNNASSLLDYYSRYNPSPLSIQKFLDFGRKACEQKSFAFLRKELPVRLANIMKEFSMLPKSILHISNIRTVQHWYLKSFEEMLQFEKPSDDNHQTLHTFCETLIRIRNRHSDVVPTLAQGLMQWKESREFDPQSKHTVEYFLHRFYLNRISIRMLINQHAALFGADLPGHPRHIGCIDPNCEVLTVVKDAYENARFLCDQHYAKSPEITYKTHNIEEGIPISLVYVPSHLYYIAFELLKNSMRALVEKFVDSDSMPPIKLLFVKGKEDLTIRFSDLGGGISRSSLDKLFDYTYSTAPKPLQDSHDIAPPLAGFGHGLPLSRLYARYLQGDLIVSSCEGFGTDASLYLKVLSNEANEVLPVFNRTSSKHYKSFVGTHDYQIGRGI